MGHALKQKPTDPNFQINMTQCIEKNVVDVVDDFFYYLKRMIVLVME